MSRELCSRPKLYKSHKQEQTEKSIQQKVETTDSSQGCCIREGGPIGPPLRSELPRLLFLMVTDPEGEKNPLNSNQ